MPAAQCNTKSTYKPRRNALNQTQTRGAAISSFVFGSGYKIADDAIGCSAYNVMNTSPQNKADDTIMILELMSFLVTEVGVSSAGAKQYCTIT